MKAKRVAYSRRLSESEMAAIDQTGQLDVGVSAVADVVGL